MKRHLFLAALLLLSPIAISLSPIMAATYYASPNGNGDGNSEYSPTTLAKGIKKLQNPGDTLYLLSGQYDLGNTVVQNLNGTAAKRIVISGYEGINAQGSYDAILDFRSTPYGTRGLQCKGTTTYLHIRNLTLRYSGKNNLHNEGSYNLFENLDIYGSADTGCQMKGGGNNIIRNVDSHDNFDYETMSGATANFGGNADGFADKQFTGAGNHYIGCRAWNNSDDGWDFFQRISTSQTVIENCVCYQNGTPYYDMSAHPRALGVDKEWFDAKVGTQMIDRYKNTITITLAKYPCQGNGNGFKMGGDYTNHQVLIHHCLAVGNYANGFDQNNNDGTMWVYNNSAYYNNANFGFTTAYGTNSLRNNISLLSQKTDAYKAKTVTNNDYNSWSKNFSVSKSDFQSLDTTQILAPRQADGSLSEGTFMRLREDSKLIDAGIDVNLAYNGSAPDLGCYESRGEEHKPQPEDTIPTTQPEGTHAIAFVTIPGSAEDKPLLSYLRQNTDLWIVETEAADPTTDYTNYEVIVLGSKPASSAAGFAPLKGYNKPMVLLKPWLLKNGVWSWGTAINTSDLAISISQPEHPLFRGLDVSSGQLTLFSQCNTNAVTAISEWISLSLSSSSFAYQIASPQSQPSATTVAELPAGTDCNGTVLPQPIVMIGVSEYSTYHLTTEGKQLIENAICYLLGIDPSRPQGIDQNEWQKVNGRKIISNGQLYLIYEDKTYNVQGQIVQ